MWELMGDRAWSMQQKCGGQEDCVQEAEVNTDESW